MNTANEFHHNIYFRIVQNVIQIIRITYVVFFDFRFQIRFITDQDGFDFNGAACFSGNIIAVFV